MKQMNEDIPQNIERIGGDDQCTETSKKYGEDSSRSKYDSHRDGENNTGGKH